MRFKYSNYYYLYPLIQCCIVLEKVWDARGGRWGGGGKNKLLKKQQTVCIALCVSDNLPDPINHSQLLEKLFSFTTTNKYKMTQKIMLIRRLYRYEKGHYIHIYIFGNNNVKLMAFQESIVLHSLPQREFEYSSQQEQ